MHFWSVNRCIHSKRGTASVGSNVVPLKRSGTNRDGLPHRQRRSGSRMHIEAGSSPCVSTQKRCPHGQALGAADGSSGGGAALDPRRGTCHRGCASFPGTRLTPPARAAPSAASGVATGITIGNVVLAQAFQARGGGLSARGAGADMWAIHGTEVRETPRARYPRLDPGNQKGPRLLA